MTWCLVGEPSSTTTIGDVIKNGRRGSLNGIKSDWGARSCRLSTIG
jgi:hypothetical protein